MNETPFADPDSFVRTPRLSGLSASRQGQVVATLKTLDADGSAFVDQLFEVSREGFQPLTAGKKSASLQAIGPRGEIYFTRSDPDSEKEGDALWMLPPVGEARKILRHRGGIEAVAASDVSLVLTLGILPDLADDGNDAQKVAQSSQQMKARKEAKVTAVVHERFPVRYWDADLGPTVSRIFEAPLPDLDFAADALDLKEVPLPAAPQDAHQWDLDSIRVSSDGSFALVTMDVRRRIDTDSEVWVLDLVGDATPRLLLRAEGVACGVLSIAPSNDWAIVTKELPPLPGQTVAESTFRADLATGELTLLTENEWTTGVAISDDGTVYFTADRAGRGGIYIIDEGEPLLLTPEDEYTYSYLHWAAGSLVALRSSVAEPPTVVFVDPQTGHVDVPLEMTPELDLPGTLTEVHATALDGAPLRAWLVTPEGEGPHPLVVFAHGGPWGSWNDWTWRWNPWVFAARGYAVLLPDPGISSGYGPEMMARGHDAVGDEPFTDIMALTDAALLRPDLDEERQLFAGGSYGGYMANWVGGHTGTRFNAIVTHASLWNLESMSRTTDNGGWYRWMMGEIDSGPKTGLAQSKRWSPSDSLEDIAVPMLVIHGDRDYRVPISQGLELWMDLQRTSPDLGHRFLYYPDEGHWILKPGNAAYWYRTFLDFLDEHREPVDTKEQAMGA